nr:hypothetical protein [Tanacetum cinerariifolium]
MNFVDGTLRKQKLKLNIHKDAKSLMEAIEKRFGVANWFNVESNTNKPRKDMTKTHRPDAPIVEDWISNSEDETEIEFVPKQREPSFVTFLEHVKSSRSLNHLIKDCDSYEKRTVQKPVWDNAMRVNH